MSEWLTLFQKEISEAWHNKRWIWVPLVFILLMVMDPLSYYFLPEIIEIAGNVPDNMQFDMPDMTGGEAVQLSLSQVSMFGTLIVAFLTMGTIHNERKSGTIEMTLAKPVKMTSFISAKFVLFLILIGFSLLLGLIFSAYYSSLLFSTISLKVITIAFFFYYLWLIFVLSLAFFYSALVRSSGAVLGLTLGTTALMSIIQQITEFRWPYFPNQIASHVSSYFEAEYWTKELTGTMGVIVFISALLIVFSIVIFKRREVI